MGKVIRPTYLFTGDRAWNDPYVVDIVLNGLMSVSFTHDERPIIVHGFATGLDSIAKSKADLLGLTIHGYAAEWGEYGRAAGPIRNRRILNEEDPNVCFAFHDDLANSKGTADMVDRCLMAEIPTYVISHA